MQANKKNILYIILGLAVLVVVIWLLTSNKEGGWVSNWSGEEKKVEEPKKGYEIDGPITEEDINIKYALEFNDNLKDARVEIPGASPISQDDKVMTYEGGVADNTAEPGSAEAPKPTLAISKEDLTPETIMIDASAAGFSPSEITARAGEPTTISLTSIDEYVHVLRFEAEQLKAVSLGVMPGETRAITFNAPADGTYNFYCEVPEHKERGEVGTMIVR